MAVVRTGEKHGSRAVWENGDRVQQPTVLEGKPVEWSITTLCAFHMAVPAAGKALIVPSRALSWRSNK